MGDVEQVNEADVGQAFDVDACLRSMGHDPDEVREGAEAALQEALARVEAQKERQLRALALRQRMTRPSRAASGGDGW